MGDRDDDLTGYRSAEYFNGRAGNDIPQARNGQDIMARGDRAEVLYCSIKLSSFKYQLDDEIAQLLIEGIKTSQLSYGFFNQDSTWVKPSVESDLRLRSTRSRLLQRHTLRGQDRSHYPRHPLNQPAQRVSGIVVRSSFPCKCKESTYKIIRFTFRLCDTNTFEIKYFSSKKEHFGVRGSRIIQLPANGLNNCLVSGFLPARR